MSPLANSTIIPNIINEFRRFMAPVKFESKMTAVQPNPLLISCLPSKKTIEVNVFVTLMYEAACRCLSYTTKERVDV